MGMHDFAELSRLIGLTLILAMFGLWIFLGDRAEKSALRPSAAGRAAAVGRLWRARLYMLCGIYVWGVLMIMCMAWGLIGIAISAGLFEVKGTPLVSALAVLLLTCDVVAWIASAGLLGSGLLQFLRSERVEWERFYEWSEEEMTLKRRPERTAPAPSKGLGRLQQLQYWACVATWVFYFWLLSAVGSLR